MRASMLVTLFLGSSLIMGLGLVLAFHWIHIALNGPNGLPMLLSIGLMAMGAGVACCGWTLLETRPARK